MSVSNFVVVQATFGIAPNYASGDVAIWASGTLMDSPYVAVVYPWIHFNLDSLGSLSVPAGKPGSTGGGAPNSGVSLLASDNFAPGDLLYSFKLQVSGMATVTAYDIPVLFSAGPVQGLWTVLESAGWQADVI